MDFNSFFDKIMKYAFYLLFFLVPLVFSPINYELFEYPKMMLVYVLTAVIMVAWLGKMILQNNVYIKRTPLDIPILLYLISSILSTIFSIDPYTSVWGYYSRAHGGLMSTICYVLLYYAFVSNMNHCCTVSLFHCFKNKKTEKKSSNGAINCLYILLASAFLVASYGILEHFGIDAQYWVQDVQNRVFSTLGQPNWLGAFLAAIIFIPLGNIIREEKRYSLQTTGYWLLLFTVYFLCLIFTNSRSALLAFWLCFGLFTIIIFWVNKKVAGKTRPLQILFISTLLSYLLLGGKTYQYLEKLPHWLRIFSGSSPITTTEIPELKYGFHISESSEIRKVVWQGALKIWQHYPFFGSGLETFGYAYYNFRPASHNLLSEWDFLYNKAHNEFLNILACQGAIGLITYLGVIGTFIGWSIRELKMKNSKLKVTMQNSKLSKQELLTSSCNFALFCGYAAILITNFFGFSVVITGLLFWFIPAFCFINTKDTKEKQNKPKIVVFKLSINKNIKYVLWVIILSFLLFVLYSLLQRWRADYHYNRGVKFYQTDYLLPALTELQQAVSLNQKEALYSAYLAKTSAKLAVVYQELEATESSKLSQQLASLAESSMQRTLALNKVHLNFWKNKAEVYLLLSYLEPEYKQEAKGALMEAKRLAPTDAKILYNLGLLEEQDKNFVRAIYLWQEALQLKPDYTRVYLKLAETYLKIGEKEKAQEKLNFVLENINPKNLEAKEMLENLKIKDG